MVGRVVLQQESGVQDDVSLNSVENNNKSSSNGSSGISGSLHGVVEKSINKKSFGGRGWKKGSMRGKGGPQNATCEFRGVRQRTWGKWVAEIREPKKRSRLWLGSFASAEEAARAYDDAARKLYGVHAHINLPPLQFSASSPSSPASPSSFSSCFSSPSSSPPCTPPINESRHLAHRLQPYERKPSVFSRSSCCEMSCSSPSPSSPVRQALPSAAKADIISFSTEGFSTENYNQMLQQEQEQQKSPLMKKLPSMKFQNADKVDAAGAEQKFSTNFDWISISDSIANFSAIPIIALPSHEFSNLQEADDSSSIPEAKNNQGLHIQNLQNVQGLHRQNVQNVQGLHRQNFQNTQNVQGLQRQNVVQNVQNVFQNVQGLQRQNVVQNVIQNVQNVQGLQRQNFQNVQNVVQNVQNVCEYDEYCSGCSSMRSTFEEAAAAAAAVTDDDLGVFLEELDASELAAAATTPYFFEDDDESDNCSSDSIRSLDSQRIDLLQTIPFTLPRWDTMELDSFDDYPSFDTGSTVSAAAVTGTAMAAMTMAGQNAFFDQNISIWEYDISSPILSS